MARRTAEDQLRKLNGLPPYDTPSNYVRGDGYFWLSIKREFSKKDIDAAKKKLGIT